MICGIHLDQDRFLFFQAEDGIRDHCVTGVQTCALPICQVQIMYGVGGERWLPELIVDWLPGYEKSAPVRIGRASCRERVEISARAVSVKKKRYIVENEESG